MHFFYIYDKSIENIYNHLRYIEVYKVSLIKSYTCDSLNFCAAKKIAVNINNVKINVNK